jgi:phosphopantetheine binding protein
MTAWLDGAGGLDEAVVTGVLIEVWRELFDDQTLGADADFHELGGSSLVAVRVRSRVRARLGRELELEDVFEHPTPAELARLTMDAPPCEPDEDGQP